MTFSQGKRVLVGLAITAIAFGMGGCSSDNVSSAKPGTALESMGVVYTEDDVTGAADQLTSVTGQEINRVDVVGMLAEAQVMFAVMNEQGIEITDDIVNASVDQYLESSTSSITAEQITPATSDVLVYASVYSTVSQMVSADSSLAEQLTTLLAEPNTVINPRYLVATDQGLQLTGPLADVVTAETTSSTDSSE